MSIPIKCMWFEKKDEKLLDYYFSLTKEERSIAFPTPLFLYCPWMFPNYTNEQIECIAKFCKDLGLECKCEPFEDQCCDLCDLLANNRICTMTKLPLGQVLHNFYPHLFDGSPPRRNLDE